MLNPNNCSGTLYNGYSDYIEIIIIINNVNTILPL